MREHCKEQLDKELKQAADTQSTADQAVKVRRLAQDDVAALKRELSAAHKQIKALESELSQAKLHASGEEERTKVAVDAALDENTVLQRAAAIEELQLAKAAAANELQVTSEHFARELEHTRMEGAEVCRKLECLVQKQEDKIAELKKYKPPPAAREASSVTDDAIKSRAYRDKTFLRSLFEEREFELRDMSAVLQEHDYLYHLMFNTSEGWRHLMHFLRHHEEFGINQTWYRVWTAQLAVKLKVDYGLSIDQIEGVRHLISHKFTRSDNNTARRRWITNPFNEQDFINFPSPIVTKHVWLPVWQAISEKVGFGLSQNGKVAIKDFKLAVVQQIQSDLQLLPELSEFTKDFPMFMTLSPDACGVFSFKLLHFLLRNSSYLGSVHRNSAKRGTTAVGAASGPHYPTAT